MSMKRETNEVRPVIALALYLEAVLGPHSKEEESKQSRKESE